jgi:hypothetical protein
MKRAYAPLAPLNGWFDATTGGATAYRSCNPTEDGRHGEGEVCRHGYREAH